MRMRTVCAAKFESVAVETGADVSGSSPGESPRIKQQSEVCFSGDTPPYGYDGNRSHVK